ncbi:MAG: BON domain-containing protein [Acidobacteria bacterium]|nr:BON domain-containing protein [Acidobacteriota bacterium]MBI3473822.1 BON domain-containing protein [Candidatus Solibacter usitatus]
MKRTLNTLILTSALAVGLASAATTTSAPMTDSEIAAKAAKEIRTYYQYTIWDNVALEVRDGHAELSGQVSQPFKKKDMERLVQRVPGVTSVTNRLEVLPTSFYDDELRIRIARAIYRHPALSRYAIQYTPPIHIIVKNGHVTLEGIVNNELERTVAFTRASTAALSLGKVENNLRVENEKKRG